MEQKEFIISICVTLKGGITREDMVELGDQLQLAFPADLETPEIRCIDVTYEVQEVEVQ